MLTFLIIMAIVITGVVMWRRRVPLLAKLLGQSESRIRQINRKR
jgi:cytochrome b subunit of formate dehydrogenase